MSDNPHGLGKWLDQELKAYAQRGDFPGSPKETGILAQWRRERPKMCQRLGPDLLRKLAFVLVAKDHQAVVQYLQAGLPPTDAEEQAAKEWLLLEPENEHPTPLLSDLTSNSATQKGL